MSFRLIEPEDPLWNKRLKEVQSDFYQYPGYVKLAGQIEKASGFAAYIEEGADWILVPILKRSIEDGWFDAVSPYGYSGILGNPSLLPVALENLERLGCVSLFLRFHPLYNPDLGQNIGKTVVIDLSKSVDELAYETRKDHRQGIARLEKEGFEAEIDKNWSFFDDFFEIYSETMKRLEASKGYFFSRDYFLGLRNGLSGNLHLCVVKKCGSVTAAGLFSEVGGLVQFHLSGTHSAYLKNAPSKLMLHFMRFWAKERGNRWFHLGGGVGGREDSLFKFKSGFSSVFCDFQVGRYILNPKKYDQLVSRRGVIQSTDFFPVYRA